MTLRMETPARSWRDALPCGNGALGALVYGRIARERILLNHEALWSQGTYPSLPDTSARLTELRTLLTAGHFAEAETFFPDLWKEAGFSAEPAHVLPGPDVMIDIQTEHPFEDYFSTLDMRTGEVRTGWRENGFRTERSVFVSRTDHVVVIRLVTDRPDGLDATFSLAAHDALDSLFYSGFGGVRPPETVRLENGSLVHLRAQFEDGTGYEAELRVCNSPVDPGPEGLRVRGVQEVVALVRLTPHDEPRAPWPTLCEYADLLASHSREQREMMGRVFFSLGGDPPDSCERMLLNGFSGGSSLAMKETLFHYGRYLLISSSTGTARLPAHLQGLWNGDYQPAWTGGYFLNENLEMNYWAALGGQLAESMRPLFDLIESHLDDFRENARKMYGCGGVLLPLFMSPRSGRKHNPQPHVVYWTAGGGWIAQHFYDYFLYTLDREFLRKRALPFMLEAARFYMDFFAEGPDGFWVSAPSQSPENKPLGNFPEAGRLSVCVNATMDFAVARELFGNLIDAAQRLGGMEREAETWRTFLDKIPPYRINRDGALAEWMDDRLQDNYHHRHLPHLYPLFPGRELCSETVPERVEACRIALDKRRVIGLKDQTGWSLAHMAGTYARLGEGDRALDCLRLLSRSCLGKNLFAYHNSDLDMGITQPLIEGMPAPFQIDANFGFTAAVIEMLLYSAPGLIRILPALPAAWPEGRLRGVCCHGAVTIDLEWRGGGREVNITLFSQCDQSVRVRCSTTGQAQSVELNKNAPVSLVFQRGTQE